jgi:hypothetical protein
MIIVAFTFVFMAVIFSLCMVLKGASHAFMRNAMPPFGRCEYMKTVEGFDGAFFQ